MKFLLSALTWFKYVLIPPFGALLIWFMTSFSSSLTRYVLPFLAKLMDGLYAVLSTWLVNDQMNGDTNSAKLFNAGWSAFMGCLTFVGNWVYGLNNWIDLSLLVNTCATLLLVQFAYVGLRLVLKLVTVGQV